MSNVIVIKPPEKEGAGMLFTTGYDILLLLRSEECRNPCTWGLPGGNTDGRDTDRLETAVRESREEMGKLPVFTLISRLETYRGKRFQKHFTVFVASVTESDRQEYVPTLNKEHTDYRWFPYDTLGEQPELHPVLHRLMTDSGTKLKEALRAVRIEQELEPGDEPDEET